MIFCKCYRPVHPTVHPAVSIATVVARLVVCVCLWQVAGLRRQLVVGRDAAMEEVQLRNKFLSDKLERLEQEFASRQPTGVSPVCDSLILL